MESETRLGMVLFGSVVLWLPALGSFLQGELNAGTAGIRYAVGAVLAWVAVTALNQLVVGYASATAGDEGPVQRGDTAPAGPQAASSTTPRRRTEDRAGETAGDNAERTVGDTRADAAHDSAPDTPAEAAGAGDG